MYNNRCNLTQKVFLFNLSTMHHSKMGLKLQTKLQIYEECDSEKMHGFVVFDIVFILRSYYC